MWDNNSVLAVYFLSNPFGFSTIAKSLSVARALVRVEWQVISGRCQCVVKCNVNVLFKCPGHCNPFRMSLQYIYTLKDYNLLV